MKHTVILPVSLLLLLSGCTSLHRPCVGRDYFETQYRGVQALNGDEAAFERLAVLQEKWAARGKRGVTYNLLPWDRSNRDRAAEIAAGTARVVAARDAVLAQKELGDVMINALNDLESEYDTITAMLEESNASAAAIGVAADQKYLARRMANSLLQMSRADMRDSVEAADTFGRDVARFQRLLDAAINGDEELGIDPPDNPEVEDSLSQIEELFSGYVAESSADVLEHVVGRYEAWSALAEMAVVGDSVLAPDKAPAPAVATDGASASAAEAAAVDAPADDAAGEADAPEGLAGESGTAEDAAGTDAPVDEGGAVDEGDVDDAGAGEEEEAAAGGK